MSVLSVTAEMNGNLHVNLLQSKTFTKHVYFTLVDCSFYLRSPIAKYGFFSMEFYISLWDMLGMYSTVFLNVRF